MSAGSYSCFAQDAQISGSVTDPQGKALRGATVTLVEQGTQVSRVTTTNGSGLYTEAFLPTGRYSVQVAFPGFSLERRDGLVVQTGQRAVANFSLRLGLASTSVTVAATGVQLRTESAAVQTVIDRNFAADLPLNGRSFDTLFLLVPGVTPSPIDNPGGYAVNGQRTEGNQYYIDGVSANVGDSNTAAVRSGGTLGLGATSSTGGTNALLSTDALQEFQVQTSSYAPEYGRSPGGQFVITSRSGTNQWHGTAFDYLRNEDLDANNWINNNLAITRPEERQNDFGGVFGGPIWRNHTFFFFSYEGLRLVQPETTVTAVPSLDTRQSVPAAVQPVVNLFPQPTGPGLSTTGALLTDCSSAADCIPSGLAQDANVTSNPNGIDASALRIDHHFGDRFEIFGRYDHAPSSGTNPNGLSPQVRTYKLDTLTAGATWIATPRITNELRYNYSRSEALTLEEPPAGTDASDTNFANFEPGRTPLSGYIEDSLAFGGASTYVVWGTNSKNQQTQWNVVDQLAWTAGKHQLGFGVDYRQLTGSDIGFPNLSIYEFTSLADLMAARISANILLARSPNTYRFPVIGLYAQDLWRLTPRLVLTYGARWDYGSAPNFIAGPAPLAVTGFHNFSTLSAAPAGTSVFHAAKTDVAPRVGLAYTLRGGTNTGTVLRGAFGVFYDVQGTSTDFLTLGNTAEQVYAGRTFPLTQEEDTPPSPIAMTAPFSSVSIVDPNLKSPRTYQWNTALEQQLGTMQTFTATYVGASGRQLLRSLLVPNLNASFIGVTTVLANQSSSNYQALQLQYNRRLSQGLQVLAGYTYAHSIDNGSDYDYETGPIENYNPFRDRGASDFDIRNTFSFGGHYAVPAWTGGDRAARAVVNGWSVDPFIYIESAPPVDVYISATADGNSLMLRPDRVPGMPLTIHEPGVPRGFALNPAAVSNFAAGYGASTPLSSVRQGTLGRNTFRGYNLVQPDVALARSFPVYEQLHLLFRADAFNFVNHPNFAQPNAQLNAPDFGIAETTAIGNPTNTFGNLIPIYHTGAPRSLQVSLKLLF